MSNNGSNRQLNQQDLIDMFKLTYKQASYVLYYKGNATEAARKAGYKQPNVLSARLSKNKLVQEAISYVNRPTVDHSALSKDGIIASFLGIVNDAKSTNADRLRALENISKIMGVYSPDKKAIVGHFSSNLERYSDKELQAKVAHSLLMLEDLGIELPSIGSTEEVIPEEG